MSDTPIADSVAAEEASPPLEAPTPEVAPEAVPAAAAAAVAPIAPEDFTKPELVNGATALGLPTSGTKADLVDRINAAPNADEGTAAFPAAEFTVTVDDFPAGTRFFAHLLDGTYVALNGEEAALAPERNPLAVFVPEMVDYTPPPAADPRGVSPTASDIIPTLEG